MNTITKTAATTTASTHTILAIDLGKYKSSGEFRFTRFETSRAQLSRLLAKHQPAVVIIEACLLAGWVHDLCVEQIAASSSNPEKPANAMLSRRGRLGRRRFQQSDVAAPVGCSRSFGNPL
jgi:hypothetical protein